MMTSPHDTTRHESSTTLSTTLSIEGIRMDLATTINCNIVAFFVPMVGLWFSIASQLVIIREFHLMSLLSFLLSSCLFCCRSLSHHDPGRPNSEASWCKHL
jgi:hypothetical protein